MSRKLYLLLLATLSSLSLASSIDTLTSSESLNFKQTLISKGQKYEVGFFTPLGAERNKIYLGIWYYKLAEVRTVVWVANRDNPVNDSSSVVLELSDGGGQIVIMEKGRQIWSSMKSLDVVNPVLQLLDTGNLVVREVDNYIWQSFDYPTDTLLPGQKLGWDNKTGLNRHLVSWKSASDPSSGNYSYSLTRTGDPEIFLKGGTQTIFRTGPFMGQGLSGVVAMKPSTGINFTLIDTPDDVYYMFTLIDPSIRSRFVMGSDGLSYRYVWVSDPTPHWNTFWYYPEDSCDKYMVCGPYGVCDTNKPFNCGCPQGFLFRDSVAVNLRDGTLGCKRRTRLECGSDGFEVMSNMKMPMSGAATVDMRKELKECKVMCGEDCGCTAYANARVVEGEGSGCVMWKGDLLDMRSFQDGGQDLYIRLAGADLSAPNDSIKNKKITIGIGVFVAFANFIVVTVACYARKSRHKASATTDQSVSRLETRHDLLLIGTSTPKKDLSNGADDFELPLYKFDDIVAATNNFSDENKLGQGGFGCVFKGVLNDQEIAVKRLSKESVQGSEEFKNEVNLIAKLQHRNLVRLLGYCVEREEKMLIYEYLRNRSLDFVLFHKERCSLLDWKKRFNIICGIARGLLYLHHDSRLRIVHRDLKVSNILLDDNMNPKISDFGMARIFKGDETTDNTSRVVGTYGYMSPEYVMEGVFSTKSDVFSFGVLVLEIVTGKKNRIFYHSHQALNLLGHAWKMWEEGKGSELLDPLMGDSYPLHEGLKCIQVGLLCVQAIPEERPTMSSVILQLSSETTSLAQPKLPGFYLEWRHDDNLDSNPSQQDESVTINQVTITTIDGR